GLSDNGPGGNVRDAWTVSTIAGNGKNAWGLPWGTFRSQLTSINQPIGPGCALLLEDPHPRDDTDLADGAAFAERARTDPAPVVVIKYLSFDALHPAAHWRQTPNCTSSCAAVKSAQPTKPWSINSRKTTKVYL
ncbi:MAG: hypothetical protein VX228_07615, partial [Pseudomonadota bacterium]|nr:hypothetical protein [Pseudomonadota bacterium]